MCSFCDPTKTIPHYPAKGATGAPTRTELMALTVCQAALRLDPKIDLKKQTIAYCRKLTEDTDGTKKPDEVAAPLVSIEALEMLMDEHGQEVTDPAEFVAWAKSLGIDLCAPLITTLGAIEEAEEVTPEAKEQAAVTPGYGWVQDSPEDATPASTGPQVIAKQAAELRQMQEQLVQAQAQLRAQEATLRAVQELAPAPPAAPRTREPAEHLRPVQPMTPVVSSALAALHAATPISSLGRVLAPVPEEPLVSTRGESKSKGNLEIQSVSYTEAFARGVAYQAQAHMEMERRIVALQKNLKDRTWSWPLAYLLKLPLTMTQAMLAAIKALQTSTTGSAEKTLLWGIILTLAIDKFGVRLTPAVHAVLRYATRTILGMLGVLGQRLISMSKRGVSTMLAQILATFASVLSTLSTSMSPTLTVVAPAQREHSEAAHVIAQIHEHMLSPLVTVVVPVGNLDGTIDTSVPGVQQIIWVDGRNDEPGAVPNDASSGAYVHVEPGGFATVRFREQDPHPQDDVEDEQQADRERGAVAYDSTEELEAFMTQAVHEDDVHPHVRRTSTLDHARLYAAVAERYEVIFCDRRDPTASWSASHKVASLLSTWITEHIDGDTVTHFDLGPHRTVRDFLADSTQFHLVFMQAAHHYHDRVLPATVRIQTAVLKHNWRKLYHEYRAWKRAVKLAASASTEPPPVTGSAPSMPTDTRARPVVVKMAVQPPRTLPKLLACVRIHDREVRTYEFINRYPRRGLACKYQTIVFWDEGCTEIKNSTDFAFEADRFHEYRVQDERISHVMQEREDQLRARRAAQVNGIQLTSALVTIESWEDTGFDLFDAPRDEYGMRVHEAYTSDLTRRVAWERRRRLAQREEAEAHHLRDQDFSEQPEDESRDSSYDPDNLRCPDRVPGCFCGDDAAEYAAARLIQYAWRVHLQLRLATLKGDMLVPLHNTAQHMRSPDEPRFLYGVTRSLVKTGIAPTGHVELVFEVEVVLKDRVRVSLLDEARDQFLIEIPFNELWRCVILESELPSHVVPLVGENIASWIPCLTVEATAELMHLRRHLVELWLDGKASGLILRGSPPEVHQYAGRDAGSIRDQHVLLPLLEVPVAEGEIRSRFAPVSMMDLLSALDEALEGKAPPDIVDKWTTLVAECAGAQLTARPQSATNIRRAVQAACRCLRRPHLYPTIQDAVAASQCLSVPQCRVWVFHIEERVRQDAAALYARDGISRGWITAAATEECADALGIGETHWSYAKNEPRRSEKAPRASTTQTYAQITRDERAAAREQRAQLREQQLLLPLLGPVTAAARRGGVEDASTRQLLALLGKGSSWRCFLRRAGLHEREVPIRV